MTLFRKIYIAIIFNIAITAIHAQDLLDYGNSLKYANYLYENKEFNFAALEFERVVFLGPTDTLSKLKLVKAYRNNHQPEKAIERMQNLFPGGPRFLPASFATEYANCLFLKKQYRDVFDYMEKCVHVDTLVKIQYMSSSLLMQHRWNEARQLILSNIEENELTPAIGPLYNISRTGMGAKYKNPFIAAGMSALVPGSGKIYAGQWKDALYSFIFISSGSWLTYKSHQRNGFNFNTAFLGTISFGFYLSNIHGSRKSALKFNQKLNDKITADIESIMTNN